MPENPLDAGDQALYDLGPVWDGRVLVLLGCREAPVDRGRVPFDESLPQHRQRQRLIGFVGRIRRLQYRLLCPQEIRIDPTSVSYSAGTGSMASGVRLAIVSTAADATMQAAPAAKKAGR